MQAVQMAQIFAADLAKIGITTKLQGMPIATHVQVVRKASTTPDIWLGGWSMDYPDDAEYYWSTFYSKNVPVLGNNYARYSDPTTDRELLEARASTDPKKAYRLYQKVCDRVYDLAIGLWPVQQNDLVALRTNVHGYQYNFLEGYTYYPLYNMYRS
jgi:peptide/nickel transport system substrate-binding protein